ncbi:MAG: phosphonates-binding protein [Bdellovibrionales bacterium RIFCSPHIGHO2_01_FULL_40_29]|nr:MAG: phosphonates-binding protein [Bdellovibrionales bacterium RIFCSPHIGHO2_01_FULL_40_29]OFZ35430.1 MAG: phosphonates-binding protein [Bdellovibrionales bacterium RIFCSPHIGHO2_02_FULL_40_15]
MSCTNSKTLGSKENPIRFFLIPAQDMQTLSDNGKVLQEYLTKETGLNVQVDLPVNFIAVVEAFGSKRADAAIINTFGYILAHDKYGVEARLKLMNRGRDEYYGQIIARADSKIKSVKDIHNKKFAFVDPASTSGYLLPMRLFKEQNVKPKEHVFSGRHDTVVAAVYQNRVDAGATFHTPADEEGPKDARMLLKTQYPDVYEKIKILQLTGPIPNDPVAFRKDLPEEIKVKIAEALIKYIKTPDGAKVLHAMYHITDFKKAEDKDYDLVRNYLKDIGQSAQDFLKK